MTWRRFSVLAVLVLAIAAYCREPAVAPVAPEPTATLRVVIVTPESITPTAQPAGPATTRAPVIIDIRDPVLVRTRVPPVLVLPTDTPTPTALPQRSPVMKG